MKIRNIQFTVILTLFISSILSAQFTNCKVEEIEELKQNGTVVVAISDDEATNKSVQEAMNTYWKASKFKVIKKSEVEAYVKVNPKNYILTYLMDNQAHTFITHNSIAATPHNLSMNKSQAGTYTTGKTATIGDGLILVKDAKKIKKLKPTDCMMYCFIDTYMGAISEQAEFIRQIGEMNAVMTYPNLNKDQVGGWKIVTIDQKAVLKKELWIAEDDLNKKGRDDEKMKVAYKPNTYKIVTKEEIAKAIIEKRSDIVYLASAEYQVGAYMFLIHNPEDNGVLFALPGSAGFDAKSFEKIKKGKVYGN